MSNYASFAIQFIRESEGDGVNDELNDDVLTVKPDGNGRYCVRMEFSNTALTSIKGKKSESYMTYYELNNYLHNLFNIIRLDEDPYEFYQIDMPLMPSVILNQKRLHKVQEFVLDQLEDYEMNGSWTTYVADKDATVHKQNKNRLYESTPHKSTPHEKVRRVLYNEDGVPSHMWFD
jgi:hypothetical protein